MGFSLEACHPLAGAQGYSNAGISLLGYLVMTATGTPWDNQLNDEILQPLSMHNTTLRPSRGQVERMPPNKPVDEFVLKFQKPM